ncbi:HAMP domain-containing sensor histidine kinase [Thermus amyloliquefaciens]|uniref:HAMP domain-containing sensor histidine kinase n=1 Tax=Thermus amyloliquefaciens TaxID=1449080 RepID=UPI00056F96C3|nr:HAMP domain-containing sensor histidine kinase [Thermus amyloliquefaciens]
MSLRARLAYAFFLLAAAVGLLSLLLGYVVFRNLVERDIALDLSEVTGRVLKALELTETGPRLRQGDVFLGTHYAFGFRLSRDGVPILEGGFSPEEGEAWRTAKVPWKEYTLEVYLRVEEYQRALGTYLRASLSLLLPLLLLAALLGSYFASVLSKPLQELAQAVENLSALRFPNPLAPVGERELAQVIHSFNRLVEAVRGALERERLLTRYASHELRSPLAVLRSQVEALKGGLLPLEEVLPHLESALARMERTLEGLLALSRAEGDLEVDLIPLELTSFLRDYLKGQEGVRFQRLPSPEVSAGPGQEEPGLAQELWVLAHPLLLERILDNLLENALRHGAPPMEIGLGAGREEVVLEVRDHGPGVREEALPHLTRPFFREHKGGEGLGLGLALVEQGVKRLGGKLEAENARPGLRIRIRLPRWRGEAADLSR